MSELKVHTFDDFSLHDMINCKFYLKSEADKVIADKDKEIQRLENLCESYRIDCDNLAIREANAYKEIGRDNKQIRRHKYKRCLAMAERCKDKIENPVQYDEHDDWLIINEFWERWHRRWLELAEKFKPNSTAQ